MGLIITINNMTGIIIIIIFGIISILGAIDIIKQINK
jgi:hypothetical protein